MRYLLYRLKYLYGQYLPLRTPVDISLELASACNMACSYCFHADPKNLPFKKGIMKSETAIEILDQAGAMGVNSVKMNWRGESTLNPYFGSICSYAKMWNTQNKSAFIDRLSNSNFKFINKRDDIFRGLACQTKVKVSMDSFVKDVFETQRAGGIHKVTLKNIDTFYNHPSRIKSETKMVIQAVRTKLNKDEDLEHEIKSRWPDCEASIRDMVGGRVETDLSDFEDKERDFENRQSCKQAHVRLIFNYKGDASPCCPDIKKELHMGSIHHSTLEQIFNNKRSKSLRKNLKSGKAFDEDPCKNCSSFESFKGYKASFHA